MAEENDSTPGGPNIELEIENHHNEAVNKKDQKSEGLSSSLKSQLFSSFLCILAFVTHI